MMKQPTLDELVTKFREKRIEFREEKLTNFLLDYGNDSCASNSF